MANIVPKLNLNKTPSIVDDNSLIFAKNIRLDVDQTIHRDYGTIPLSLDFRQSSVPYNHKNIFKRILFDINKEIEDENSIVNKDFYKRVRRFLSVGIGEPEITQGVIYEDITLNLVGYIPSSNEFYLFIYTTFTAIQNKKTDKIKASYIIRYDEKEDLFEPCNCNWNYNLGVIDGCVVNNLRGEKILNIGETNTNVSVPFKCINLSKSSIEDDETIYTQSPNIPITNLNYLYSFNFIIPNGIYQFFIRYKIREDFYTDWFIASKEVFAGNSNNTITSFGTVKYINTHRDSDNSFTFEVEHLHNEYCKNYESFQVGFIISHDDEIVARAWKHFPLDTSVINFDYNSKDAEEIEVVDLLKQTYNVYDVGNVVSFKNKLYISNYKETNFNDETLQEYADKVSISLKTKIAEDGYAGYTVIHTTLANGSNVISGLKVDGSDKSFSGNNGIVKELINSFGDTYKQSFVTALTDAIGTNDSSVTDFGNTLYRIKYSGKKDILSEVKKNKQESYERNNSDFTKNYNFVFNDNIVKIKINNQEISGNTVTDVLNAIYNLNFYLNDNCIFVNNLGSTNNKITVSIIRYFSYTQSITSFSPGNKPSSPNPVNVSTYALTPGGSNVGDYVTETKDITDVEYEQTITINLQAYKNEYVTNDLGNLAGNQTLIPYQKYKFYIHFVKQTGEITNGYYCSNAGIIEVPYQESANCIIYPVFKNYIDSSLKGYVACFFSIAKIGNVVESVFNIKKDSDGDYEGSCIGINLGLIQGSNNITIYQDNNTFSGKYFYSGDSSVIKYFGADGIIQFNEKDINENLAYAINEYSIFDSNNIELEKCTPYISLTAQTGVIYNTNYDEPFNLNLLGFICTIYPLHRETVKKYYTDSNSVFKKSQSDTGALGTGYYFRLTELRNHLQDAKTEDEKITALSFRTTDAVNIYSNYNLNYLALSSDPTEKYITYYNDKSTGGEVVSNADSNTIVLRLFPSLTLSSVYELPNMYREYTRKLFYPAVQDYVTEFNNTIRSSTLEGDESFMNVFKFDAEDYYNVPTNRGIIVNLESIGDSILVHTKDSMFRFSGSNSLQSENGNIRPHETDVFDTGVTEVFGSDFGFAGLQDKRDCITTELGYIFFDRDSRIVYMYSGQGQIVKLSDSIEKLFKHRDIKNIHFANDYYNNRFFLCIIFYDNKDEYPITLSFSILDDVKSFVSLHDFYYYNAFNTKTKCYFLTKDYDDICIISSNHIGCYTKLELLEDKIYVSKREDSNVIQVREENSKIGYIEAGLYDSIVDIICNTNYETVKTLNAINWCSSRVTNDFVNIDKESITTLKMLESVNNDYPCNYLRVYTNTCITPLYTFTKPSNQYSINSLESYKYPRFNQGYWTYNYFRDIQNTKDIFNYLQNNDAENKTVEYPEGTPKYNDGRRYQDQQADYLSDNNSLIEGLYFVARLGFRYAFKLETIKFNFSNKL